MFGGRSICGNEENYPINQLEQAAIVEGYKDNYHLLFGRETYIYCDNKPSIERAAKTEKSFFGILQDLISQTNSRVYYLPGNKQIMADFLSRYRAPQIMSVNEPIMNQMAYLEHIINKQANDPEISDIKRKLIPVLLLHLNILQISRTTCFS